MKIILKGSKYGTKIIKSYANSDILHSIVDNVKCEKNSITLRYDKNKNAYYVYHSFDNLKKYSGRWYNTNVNFSLIQKDMTMVFTLENIEWTDFDTDKTSIKNVVVKIFLSASGYKKMTKYVKNNV